MKECIILAGGLGTRLQPVVKDVPKCMAEVAGKPFLHYIFQYLQKQQFNHAILALGYKTEMITDWYRQQDFPFEISHVTEKETLGTGGAMKFAFSKVTGDKAFVLNGDTFFDINTQDIEQTHNSKKADISIALKEMTNFDRYGTVELDNNQKITTFREKQFRESGLINGGTYLINKSLFEKLSLPQKFSFEKDIMESQLSELPIYGCIQDGYFIDIGIPSDFEKANNDFAAWK